MNPNESGPQMYAEFVAFQDLLEAFCAMSGSPEVYISLRLANNRLSVIGLSVTPAPENMSWPQDIERSRQEQQRPSYAG